jgi:hypothetical protein
MRTCVDFDGPIGRQIGQLIHLPARPLDFQTLDLLRLPDAQNLARVVRSQIASAVGLQVNVPLPLFLKSLLGVGLKTRGMQ